MRIGVDPPLFNISDVFNWPSSDEVSSRVFTNEVSQDKILSLLASYYTREGIEGPNPWDKISTLANDEVQPDLDDLVFRCFPSLHGAFACHPVLFWNHLCSEHAGAFKRKCLSAFKDLFYKRQMWNNCQVESVYRRLIDRFPFDIHQRHLTEHGAHKIDPLLEFCSVHRQCWTCRARIEGRGKEDVEELSGLVASRHLRPNPLGQVMKMIMRVMENPAVPGALLRILGV